MQEGKPKGTDEMWHMLLVFPFYIHLHPAAWIELRNLKIKLSACSVNKVTTRSTKALHRIKRAKLLIGSMAKRVFCENTQF